MKKESKIIRPNWDEYFMIQAFWVATRASCKNLKTGAVIVRDKRIISSGYNGAPPGIENCLEIGCRKEREGIKFEDKGKGVCRGTHAERNAMLNIAREYLKGTTLYTMFYPCSDCAKDIAGAGIEKVIYFKLYKELDSLTQEIFAEAGIGLRPFKPRGFDIEKYFNMIRTVVSQK